jgi:hypothetical protein
VLYLQFFINDCPTDTGDPVRSSKQSETVEEHDSQKVSLLSPSGGTNEEQASVVNSPVLPVTHS